ncbi:hypothetical protein J2Z66_004902 [Paenibacillus eucommiae]|uniref:Uncharacterized protein n=2 Tax=Paenibacillus eucommiae TaxID=1355755 RepID=A0ABS4J2E0_9BACL|nr:hypothetical protein [Paenibacillus eucommiae]
MSVDDFNGMNDLDDLGMKMIPDNLNRRIYNGLCRTLWAKWIFGHMINSFWGYTLPYGESGQYACSIAFK